jgi:hypothetical protein
MGHPWKLWHGKSSDISCLAQKNQRSHVSACFEQKWLGGLFKLRKTKMARIIEDVITIKFSKIIKDSEQDATGIAGHDIQQALEQVAQELVGDSVVVEIERK